MITPVRTTLNASTFTAVALDTNIRELVDISCYTEDGTAFIISDTLAGTAYATIPASASYKDINVNTDTPKLFAKASSGTPDLITLTSRI